MIGFIHICKLVLCPACHITSCDCKWKPVPIIGGVNYNCPHCGNIMQSQITTSSNTSISYDKLEMETVPK